MALTVYRFVGFGIMVLTVIVAAAVSGPMPPPPHTLSASASASASSSASAAWNPKDAWGFHPAGFAILVTSCAYAYTVHYNMPDALTPVRRKAHLGRIMFAGLGTSMIFFLLLGILCAYFFNGNVDPLVILNWETYTGRGGGWDAGSKTWFGWLIFTVIILYPVLNLISVYPLIAISLASNIFHLFPKRFTEKYPRLTKYTSRVCAAAPPVVLGTAFGNLDLIFMYTGLFAFFIQFFIPAVMWELSRWRIEKEFGKGSSNTEYSTRLTSNHVAVCGGFVLGLLCFVLAIVSIAT
eukprot:TRINITY_DN1023_c0_g1_i2.p1 TRINITY_DN1023_c0_g1~~TRINITY_DN1023_c0_g1_i2.p1  ORF type:complete len:294 (+),score=80.66 TRINITY_DN1023_c0_g1_i2:64-945(+)